MLFDFCMQFDGMLNGDLIIVELQEVEIKHQCLLKAANYTVFHARKTCSSYTVVKASRSVSNVLPPS